MFNLLKLFRKPKYVWRNKDHDIPVEFVTLAGVVNGVVYAEVKYEGKHSYVPKNELYRV
jgi:hypothetical protein